MTTDQTAKEFLPDLPLGNRRRPDRPVLAARRDAHPRPEYIRVLTDRYRYRWSSIEIEELNLDDHGHVRTDDEAGDAA